MEKEGYETVNAVSTTRIDTLYRKLDEKGSLPSGMVRVIGGNTEAGIALPDFFIDKYEVTNQQFKAFVDAGGYQKQAYWKHEFTKDGRKLNWEEAMDEFHDNSGRPGPSKWLAGDYPEGKDNFRDPALAGTKQPLMQNSWKNNFQLHTIGSRLQDFPLIGNFHSL